MLHIFFACCSDQFVVKRAAEFYLSPSFNFMLKIRKHCEKKEKTFLKSNRIKTSAYITNLFPPL